MNFLSFVSIDKAEKVVVTTTAALGFAGHSTLFSFEGRISNYRTDDNGQPIAIELRQSEPGADVLVIPWHQVASIAVPQS